MIAEPILNALLHLFAAPASRLDGVERETARRKVLSYLNHHVRLADADTYIGLYDDLTDLHSGEDDATAIETAREVSGHLNSLLHGFEKHTAIISLLELASINPTRLGQLAQALGRQFGLDDFETDRILRFIAEPSSMRDDEDYRMIGSADRANAFRGKLAILRLPKHAMFLAAAPGGEPVRLEGHVLEPGTCRPLNPGHVIRDRWGNELHYSEIAACFSAEADRASRIDFRGSHLDFRFPGSDSGLHDFSFSEHGGRMIAIMGGSGAGKSTMLSVLNGTLRPDSGRLLLNGHDLYNEPETLEGVIGYVPQDDLLFEDLTVFENLYYAARLCLAHLPEHELVSRVRGLLESLGQSETADLKVGSPLEKTISGGQRKRLNIALELIREPAILFVDEPTSGLSSSDSETVMSLLKEQAAADKLVFVVIHQPSSKIYRMFDSVWVLDQGGWPVFSGTPIEAIAYFRSRGGMPGEDEAICGNCGGVNPEQIFEIIESKILGHDGRLTRERRVPPEKWHEFYREYASERERAPSQGAAAQSPPASEPKSSLNRPGLFGQLKVFFVRDVRARLANRAYTLITLLEPPLLGLLIGLVSRGSFGGEYSFHNNGNLHVFFFMSVIAALFLGLSVSAEEICRDGRILRREQFLHLSWWSYVNSKSLYLAGIAALQMFLFTAVANPIVQVPGMFLKTWGMLFLCAFCSSMLGLNISASFRSAVTIYILIPLLLIPQMLLSGVVIKYDDLIASNSRRREVPMYTSILAPRWGYEALIVEQYAGNAYTRHILEQDAVLRQAEQDLDYYLPELLSRVKSVPILRNAGKQAEVSAQLRILRNEFARLPERSGLPVPLPPDRFESNSFDSSDSLLAETYLSDCRRLAFERRRAASEAKRDIVAGLERDLGRDGVEALRKDNTNQSIEDQALNLREFEPIGAAKDGLIQRTIPIYRTPESRWGQAHFLARHKRLGNILLPTYTFNAMALGLLTLALYLALCFKLLPRLIHMGCNR